MIKRLKLKLVVINMLIVVAVLSAAFAFLYLTTYKKYYDDSISAMKDALNTPFDFDTHFDVGKDASKRPSSNAIVTFYVTVGKGGKVGALIGNNVTVTDEEKFAKLVRECFSSEDKIGVIKREELRYMVAKSRFYGDVVAFADISAEIEALSRLKTLCLAIGAAAFAIFLAISVLFANWAVNPVKRSVEKQNRFIADASHELKTPLTVVLANAELLSASPEATVAEKQKQIEHIKSEANNMNMLVCDMLTLAKSDFAKKEKQSLEPVNVSEILSSVVLAFEAPVFESGKTLESNIEDSLFISGAEKSLERLFYILLDNAVKYSNEGGSIDVFLYETAGRVNVTVRNSGLPIPSEHLPHVFDRFYRPDDARSRQSGGFGLGLSIAKDTVEKHGGRISVESSDEIGTAFNISFKKLSL